MITMTEMRIGDDADVVAEVLRAEACLRPADEARRRRLLSTLGRLQQSDGALSMRDGAAPDAQHHAACVAALAASLIDPSESTLRRPCRRKSGTR